MTRRVRRSLLAASITLAAASGLAAVQGLSIKFHGKSGDEADYKFKADLQGDNGPIAFSENQVLKVKDVKPDGSYVVEMSETGRAADMGGQTANLPDVITTTEFLPNGRPKSISTTDGPADPAEYRFIHLMYLEAQDAAAKVGDEVNYEIPAEKDRETPAVKVSYKLDGTEKIKDWDTVRVTFTAQETEGDLKSSVSGTDWISQADGSLVQTRGEWKNLQPSGAPFPVSGKFTGDRIK